MIGVDGGAGKTAQSQSATYWKQILGDVNFAFRTATGELVKSGKRLCVKVSMTGESTSEFEVSKRVMLLYPSPLWVVLLCHSPSVWVAQYFEGVTTPEFGGQTGLCLVPLGWSK